MGICLLVKERRLDLAGVQGAEASVATDRGGSLGQLVVLFGLHLVEQGLVGFRVGIFLVSIAVPSLTILLLLLLLMLHFLNHIDNILHFVVVKTRNERF